LAPTHISTLSLHDALPISAGAINHALRFTVPQTRMAYIHPATHFTSSDTNPNLPPMGLRFRLKASFNISTFTGASLAVLQALKKDRKSTRLNSSHRTISYA